MVATMLSAAANARGLNRYLSPATAAHDQTNPDGASERVEYCSTIGDCRPETFLADVGRTRDDFGKTGLEIETYHLILSHSHEELDPDNPYHVWLAHQFARETAAGAFPGRQIKVTTQADNGRWEEDAGTGERVWVKGKIHSHCQVANVAEEAVTMTWTDKDGNPKTVHYPAGRAVSSDMKNIHRIRYGVVDALVMERFGFDNEAYMQACRDYARDAGLSAADRKSLARQEAGTTNAYDELRMRLRIARAQATSWDDYESRLAADGVQVMRRGGKGDGVSYKWVDADSGVTSRPARAGGRSGVGDEFKYNSVVEQCAVNTAALDRGETLAAPERVLVVPTNAVAADRPRPAYLTDNGRPPWENNHALAAYAAQVQATGGTYEQRAAEALVTNESVEGVELVREGGAVVATVDAGDGAAVFDVDAALAERVAEVEAAQAAADAGLADAAARGQQLAERERAFEGKAAAERARIDAQIATANQELAEREGAVTGRERAAATWEAETEPALRVSVRRETEKSVRDEMRDDRDAARQAREEAEADRKAAAESVHEAAGLTPEEATNRVLDEYSTKAKKALERYRVPAVEYDEGGNPARAIGADGKPAMTNAWEQMKIDVSHDRSAGSDITVGQQRRDGRASRENLSAKASQIGRASERDRTQQKGLGQ